MVQLGEALEASPHLRAHFQLQVWCELARLRGTAAQIHDEIIMEVHDDDVPAVSAAMRQIMQSAIAIRVPLVRRARRSRNTHRRQVVHISYGKRWGQMAAPGEHSQPALTSSYFDNGEFA